MTIEELKALRDTDESAYGAQVTPKEHAVLLLKDEILALVGACEDYADGCGEGLIFSALDAFNAKLEAL